MPTRLAAALLAALAIFSPALQAQSTYPGKPVHIIVGYTTGGAADAGLRPLAKVLEPLLGQPIVIEYKPGAAGAVRWSTSRRRLRMGTRSITRTTVRSP